MTWRCSGGVAGASGGFLLHARDLVGDIEGAAVLQMAQFLDLAFEFGNQFFEIEKGRHGPKNSDYCRMFNRRRKQYDYRHTACPVFFTNS